MTENIEAFVATLQKEGVQAGQAAAQRIRTEAEQEARRILEAADARARKVLDDARAESETLLARARTELDLAARDTLVRLRETLGRILKQVLLAETRDALSDTDFLKRLLQDLILQYAQADLARNATVTFNVSDQTRQQLAHWAIEALHRHAGAPGRAIDLQVTLAQAGFEYRIGDGTVEVTPESVVEVLLDLVGPELRRIIAQQAGNGG